MSKSVDLLEKSLKILDNIGFYMRTDDETRIELLEENYLQETLYNPPLGNSSPLRFVSLFWERDTFDNKVFF